MEASGTYVQFAWVQGKDSRGNIVKSQKIPAVSVPRASSRIGGYQTSYPVGLLTMYCDYGDPSRLKCPDWINLGTRQGTSGGTASELYDVAAESPEPEPAATVDPSTSESPLPPTDPELQVDDMGNPVPVPSSSPTPTPPRTTTPVTPQANAQRVDPDAAEGSTISEVDLTYESAESQ